MALTSSNNKKGYYIVRSPIDILYVDENGSKRQIHSHAEIDEIHPADSQKIHLEQQRVKRCIQDGVPRDGRVFKPYSDEPAE